MIVMDKDDQKRYLKICGVLLNVNYEAIYKSAASDAVDELISRFYKDVPEERYMTDFELLNLWDWYSQIFRITYLFLFSIGVQISIEKGFCNVVGLPCIDPKESDPMRITINGYRYRAVPIYTEES